MDTIGSGSKRRKTAHGSSSLHIFNLPDNVLGDAMTYLPKPSRAMFAVAMTAPSSSWATFDGTQQQQPSAMSEAILSCPSQKSDALDFEDIEGDLAAKLSDDDIAAILACTDAVSNLKRLKLTGCVNISGHGLRPLWGSVVLEQIDLGLNKQHASSIIEPEPSLSEDAVVPILDSIVDADQNVLKHLQLPKKWRKKRGPMLREFLEKYNLLLESRGSTCSKCDESIEVFSSVGWIWRDEEHSKVWYGLQNNACSKCVKLFCANCKDEDGEDGSCYLNFCDRCERDYCLACDQNSFCIECEANFCSGCAAVKKCACWDRDGDY